MAFGTSTKFQLDILMRSTILVIYKFRDNNILESSRNVNETHPPQPPTRPSTPIHPTPPPSTHTHSHPPSTHPIPTPIHPHPPTPPSPYSRDAITHPLPHFNGYPQWNLAMGKKFHLTHYMGVITFPCWDSISFQLVCKTSPLWQINAPFAAFNGFPSLFVSSHRTIDTWSIML